MQVFSLTVQHPEKGEVERKVAADSYEDAEAMMMSMGLPVVADRPEPKPRRGRAARKDG